MKKIMTTVFIFLVTLSAQAESPYELLKKNFLMSSSPVNPSQLDSVFNETLRCVRANKNYRDGTLKEVALLKREFLEGRAPDNGPLFPGTPGTKRETVVFGKPNWDFEHAENYKTELFENELKITLDTGFPAQNQTFYARTGNDGNIYFRWDGFNFAGQGPFAEFSYGYCYRL